MKKKISIDYAVEEDIGSACALLKSRAQWLIDRGRRTWDPAQFNYEALLSNVHNREMVIGCFDNQLITVMLLQENDLNIWPEKPQGEALYLHKLCVCETHAGQGFSQQMLDWAATEAKKRGCRFLRLDSSIDSGP